MARRVPLPRLTHRQRSARWQRERRQQVIIVTIFTAILVFVLGLAAWAASDRYYSANLAPAAQIRGVDIPKRDYQKQLKFDLVRAYFENGVPPGFENDPQIQGLKAQYQDLATSHLIEHRILDLAAKDAGITPTQDQIDEQYAIDFGEFRARHILIQLDKDKETTDPAGADADAKAKAQKIADQLKAAPNDQDLWNKLAKESSDDPGSKDSGGELGFTGHGQFVAEFEDAVRTLAVGQVSDPVRSQFGYHVIQLEEKRDPSQTDIFKKYQTYGYGPADLKAESRYGALRAEFEKREQAVLLVSPQEQAHVAKITVNIPTPSSQNIQGFTDALKKQATIRDALKNGTDFAEVAKANSDDDSKDKGGDIGWVTRGMLVDPRSEDLIFGTQPGNVTDPISGSNTWAIYKVLEKTASKDVDDDQKAKIKQSAYSYWLERQKKAYDVQNVIPGFALQ